MRASVLLLVPLLLAGCGKPINGFWDIVEWEVSRDGDSVLADDCGWVMFQEDSTRGFGLLLRYDYDAAAFDLVPTADPGRIRDGFDVSGYRYERDEPEIPIRYEQGDFVTTLDFDITRYTNAEMTLETASPTVDGSNWRWELKR